MHYNHFSIRYVEAIGRNLKIVINEKGEAVYFPDSINDSDITNLKNELELIWGDSVSAIDVVREKKDSEIQAGLFGLVNELEKAFKVGFLIGDRVVLVDYLFERVLTRRAPWEVDREHLGVVASSLMNALPLVKSGRIVIIPSPFSWYSDTKKIIEEAAIKADISMDMMSLLNMLSITKHCRLHPFTIAESEENYLNIVESQIDRVDVIGRDKGAYAYEGILGALLSEKILNQVELEISPSVSLGNYIKVINANKGFRQKYLKRIISGGSLDSDLNINGIKNEVLECIASGEEVDFRRFASLATVAGGIGSSAIGLFGAFTVVSAPLAIAGAALALSATLTGLVNAKERQEDIVISVFKKLHGRPN